MANTEQEVGNQFLALVENQREDVVNALITANIDVDEDISSSKLLSVISRLVARIQDANDTNSKNAILNISKLIVSNQSSFSSFYNATEGNVNRDDMDRLRDNAEDVKDEAPKRDRFGNILSKENLDKAISVGNILIGWWNSKKDKNSEPDNTNSGGSSNNNNNNNRPPSGMSTTKIVALSFVGVLLIGGIIVAVKMSK
tara:strand:+ start:2403 stop:2999 length:597 start_codon:yes stop_codon:yes gene_type:complete